AAPARDGANPPPEQGKPLLGPQASGTGTVFPFRMGIAGVCLVLALAGQFGLRAYLQGGEQLTRPRLKAALEHFPKTLDATGVPASPGAWSGAELPEKEIQPAALPYFEQASDKLNRRYLSGQKDVACQLWMIHSLSGEDRRHHPLNCAQAAG